MDSRKVAYIANLRATLISFIHLGTTGMIGEIARAEHSNERQVDFLKGIEECIRLHRLGKLHLASPPYAMHCLMIMSKLPHDFMEKIDNEAQFDRFVRDDVEGHA